MDASPVLGLNDEVFFAGRDGYLRSLPTFSSTTENVANWEALMEMSFTAARWSMQTARSIQSHTLAGAKTTSFAMIQTEINYGIVQKMGFPFSIDGVVDSSLALTEAGTLYFGCYDSKLYCVNLGTGLASSDWPSYQRSISRDGAWPSYSLSVAVTPSGSGQVLGSGTYPQGGVITLTAQPIVHHLFIGWLNGSTLLSTDETLFISLNSNTNLTAQFVQTFSLDLSSGEGGQVTPDSTDRYSAGSNIQIFASPSTGYSFSGWSGDGIANSSDVNTTVTMTQDRSISATFSINSYNLQVSSTTGGSVSGSGFL